MARARTGALSRSPSARPLHASPPPRPQQAGIDLTLLTAVLSPQDALVEPDAPWDFDRLLQEVSQVRRGVATCAGVCGALGCATHTRATLPRAGADGRGGEEGGGGQGVTGCASRARVRLAFPPPPFLSRSRTRAARCVVAFRAFLLRPQRHVRGPSSEAGSRRDQPRARPPRADATLECPDLVPHTLPPLLSTPHVTPAMDL